MYYSTPPPFFQLIKLYSFQGFPAGARTPTSIITSIKGQIPFWWCFLHSYRANLPLEHISAYVSQLRSTTVLPFNYKHIKIKYTQKNQTKLCSRRERIRYPFSLQIFQLFYYFFLVILSRRCRFAISNCFYISLNVRSLHVFSFLRGASSAFDGQAQPICCQCSETPLISEPKSSQRCGGSSTQANYLGAASTRIQTPQRNEGRHCQS